MLSRFAFACANVNSPVSIHFEMPKPAPINTTKPEPGKTYLESLVGLVTQNKNYAYLSW